MGFSKEERESIATTIEGNLSVKEDATEEEIEALITSGIDSALPFLKYSQSVSSRVINEYKTSVEKKPLDQKKEEKPPVEGDEMPAWFKVYQQQQEERFATIEKTNRDKNYSERLTERLKDVDPKFYSLASKGKSFTSDEEFDSFIEEVETSWADFRQDRSDDGLSKSHKPLNGGGTKTGMDGIADIISTGTKTIVESQK